ncbi:dockerin type I repeat-containing protein [Botrimarina sp.]|uniref:dockerin type I repeat-containing protein n=1 Tax=Botrimarina sp. TaxID=2795802 RepID=UPI0032ED7905
MKPNRLSRLFAAVTVWLAAECGECLADGQGVLLQQQHGRLVVGYDDDTPGGQAIGARAFGELLPSNGLSQDPSFLSLTSPPAGSESLPVGVDVYWDFLPMTVGGVTSNLLHWDGKGEVGFTPAASAALTLYDPNFLAAAVDGAGAAVPGRRIGTTTASALSLHAHRYWELVGAGGAPPAPGVYTASLRLRAEGLAPSPPIYVAFATFGTPSAALNDAAVPWLAAEADSLLLRGDFDFDGAVGPDDYALWAAQYGELAPQPVDLGEADGNGDGRINAADYTVWRDAIEPATLAIPEPCAATLVALSLVGRQARRIRSRRPTDRRSARATYRAEEPTPLGRSGRPAVSLGEAPGATAPPEVEAGAVAGHNGGVRSDPRRKTPVRVALRWII